MLSVVIRLEIMSPHLTFSFERKISTTRLKNWQAIQAEGQWSRPKSISASTETGTWGQIRWSARLSDFLRLQAGRTKGVKNNLRF